MIIQLYSWSVLLAICKSTASLLVHKCCPNAEAFIEKDKCGVIARNETIEHLNGQSYSDDDNLSWFPYEYLYNFSTSTAMSDSEKERIHMLLKSPESISTGQYLSHRCSRKDVFLEYTGINPDDSNLRIMVANDGSMWIVIDAYTPGSFDEDDHRSIPLNDACFDRFEDSYQLVVCPRSKPWIERCCPSHEEFDVPSSTCREINGTADHWKPLHFSTEHGQTGTPVKGFYVSVQSSIYDCRGIVVFRDPELKYACRDFKTIKYLNDGSVMLDRHKIPAHGYCGGRTVHSQGLIVEQNILYCVEHIDTTNDFADVYGILFLTGGCFLLVTVVISWLVPQLRQHLFNKVAITHNATLMVAQFLWGINILHSHNPATNSCIIMALLIQFTFLASMFWLTIMCINLAAHLRGWNRKKTQSENGVYLMYSLYAWGGSATIVILTAVAEFLGNAGGILRPGIACYCDFSRDTMSVFIYFYLPMAALLTVNLGVYIYAIWKIRNETLISDQNITSGSNSRNQENRMTLYSKLFILMGISWIAEVVTWAVGADLIVTRVVDVINLLRAFFIFVIFVGRKSVLVSLKDRLLALLGKNPWPNDSENSVTDPATISMTAFDR